jgi:hypothetical protein
MKLPCHLLYATRNTQNVSRTHRQDGIAVLSVLGLIAIVMVYVAANVRTLHSLDGELKLVERRQIHRLQTATKAANSLNPTNSTTTPQPVDQ